MVGSAGPQTDDPVVTDELIVLTKPGAPSGEIVAVLADAEATVAGKLTSLSAYLVQFAADRRDEVRQTLEDSPLVEDVLDNHIFEQEILPGDPMLSEQWHLAFIGAPEAWTLTTGSEDVVVAVLDSGVEIDHPDLVGKLVGGGNTFDGNGWNDTSGHGTAVAGTIAAASDNHEGVVSVAWRNPVMPIRVTNSSGQTTSWALTAGIGLASSQGARVIHISFEGLQSDQFILRQAMQARLGGSLVVVSAGNSGRESQVDDTFLLGNALFVSAVDESDELAGFSTYGSFVDLAAPGVDIYTTKLGHTYGAFYGTSFAAPLVSGVAALIWSLRPEFTPSTVEEILLTTAKDLGAPGRDNSFGAGRVDAGAAIRLASQLVEQADRTPPTVVIQQPGSGSRLDSPFTLEVLAQDNTFVADVTVLIDDRPAASDSSLPYLFYVDPAGYPSGSHQVTAVATDTSGNSAAASVSLFFVSSADPEAPVVSIRSPSAGAAVQGVVTILGDARDNLGLAKVELFVDDRLILSSPLSGTQATLALNWSIPASGTQPGPRTVTVRVTDSSGNTTDASVPVNVL